MTRPPVRRLIGLLVGLAFGLSSVLVRLTVLQVREAEAYSTLALEQRLREIPVPATRGTILDRDGEDLALSLDAAAVYADPRYVVDPVGTARRIAGILGVRPRDIRSRLEREGSFVYLARQVDLRTATAIDRLGLPGIGLLDESKRYYPAAGLVAPQVVGLVGVDGVGLSGLEYQYEDELSGSAGERVLELDPRGRVIPQGIHRDVPPTPGHDLVTTIDRALQYRAQLALQDAVKRNRARGGTVVILDVDNGDVLAMATYPWFDPNDLSSLSPRTLAHRSRNRAVTDVYEPGSVNKVITAAALLEEGLMEPRETIRVPDSLEVADKTFSDAERHDPMDMTLGDIIAHSSNVGTILVADRLGSVPLAQYLARFGFGQRTGVGFPGESGGLVPSVYEWWPTSMASIPIGVGIAVTPLQMAAVYATIANDGVWVEPRLVRGTVDAGGTFTPAPPPGTRRVVSEDTSRKVTRMLVYAVRAGTGTRAEIPGYQIAGKTGTAHKPLVNEAGYSERLFVASFIGFLPASDPEIVIAVMLDEPRTVYGGIAAAPLFRSVALHAIGRLRIAPGEPVRLPPHRMPLE
ncbi:MAG: penicillin-binding protein 2 [Actinobacteria bacterium]|nr:penicillin-binding protein 2 [Actinomycetota bacterium]